MNDLKFRVWDKSIKFLDDRVRVTITKDYTKVEVLDAFTNWRELQEGQYELLLSTGLKDVNGEEIFEGDVVGHCDGECFFTGVVTHSPFGWYVKSENDNIAFEHFSNEIDRTSDCKVIGYFCGGHYEFT